jgi:DNA-binding CsgD family transcriptional regulator
VVNQLSLSQLESFAKKLSSGGPGERLFLALQAYVSALSGASAVTASDIARRALEGGRIFVEQRVSAAPWGPVSVLMSADELDEAEHAIAVAARQATRRGALRIAVSTGFRGRLAFLRGDVAAAEAELRGAVDLLRRYEAPLAAAFVLGWLMDALIERDEPEAALRELHDIGLVTDIPPGGWLNDVLFRRGTARIALGELDSGLVDVLEAGEREKRVRRVNPAGMRWALVAAPALAAQGRGAEARALAEDELARARAWGTPRVIGAAVRAMGLVEGGPHGLALLRESARMLERSPARLELARTLTDLGAALRRSNQRAAAREPLRAALADARRGGALALARRAHEELGATGERLRPLVAVGVESLTPSERRVAEQAAAGRTNREIAQTLFLTIKTVETHLSNAYRKLDIQSRRDLPAALATARH